MNNAELKDKIERTRLKRQLRQERFQAQMLEAAYGTTPWGDLIPPRDSDQLGYRAPTITAADRERGAHWLFSTEQDLQQYRDAGRLLADSNVFAQGALRALKTKVCYTGFRYNMRAKSCCEVPEAAIAQMQGELDRFLEINLWNEWEQEIFNRSRRDGEAPMRAFADQGRRVLTVRSIEPEQITQPAGVPPGREWSFGVRCDPEDQQTTVSYWVSYDGDAANGEEVSAGEIELFKVNTDRIVRRGLGDFFSVAEIAQDLAKLLRNVVRGGQVLAAIAWIEQFESASKSQVESFADSTKEYTQTNPRTGTTQRYERVEPGTVIRTGKGRQFLPPPMASNTPQLVEIARLSRLALATRWNAPECIFGDASNGSYSSLAVAESPFVATAEVEQTFYARRFKRIVEKSLRFAADLGRFDPTLLSAVEVHVEPPPIVVRDRLAMAQENEILSRRGIMSPQTWAQTQDLEWESEQAEIERAREMGWAPEGATPPPQPGLPMGGPLPALGEGRAVTDPFGWWKRQVRH